MNDRPRALAVLIAVFLGGCIVGAIGFFLWARQAPQYPPPRTGISGFRFARRPERPRLPQLLQLTPEQTDRFEQIMDESRRRLEALSRKRLEALRIEQEPKIEAIRSDVNRKISEILNPEQKKKFEELQKEWQLRRDHERHPEGRFRHPGPPP